jgi:CheY-like chemotaxis protein
MRAKRLTSILVVDDDKLVRITLRRMLASASYAMFEAKDGGEAVDIYRKRRPDLIILDIVMPRSAAESSRHKCQCSERRQDSSPPLGYLPGFWPGLTVRTNARDAGETLESSAAVNGFDDPPDP